MSTITEKRASEVLSGKKKISNQESDLTDGRRYALISKDPFFKKKAKDMEDILSNVKPHQDW